MADLGEYFFCAKCGRKQRFMKRCTACQQVFYCSKECQTCHWLDHKPSCLEFRTESERNMSPTSIEHTNTAEIYNKQDILQECSTLNNASTNKAVCEKDGDRTCDSDKLSNAMKQICLSSSQESNEAENVAKKKTVTIIIKHNKVKRELTVSPTENGNFILQIISDSVSIPVSKLKLIHKGKIATCDNIKNMLFNKALFLAFGEICESEEGLEKTEIDLIVKQLNVERNLAIRILRKTGNVLDAIIELGNM